MPQRRQPFLHDLVTVLAAPTQVWSAEDGSVRGTGTDPAVQGVLHADVRVLNRIEVLVDGLPGEHIATALDGQQATFTHLLRHVAADLAETPDPQIRLDRVRSVEPGSVEEWLTVSSLLGVPVTVEVSITFGCDFASVEVIKRGEGPAAVPFSTEPAEDEVAWSSDDLEVTLTCADAEWTLSPDRTLLTATWSLTVPAHGESSVSWELGVVDRGGVVAAAPSAPLPAWSVSSSDHRLQPWVDRSLADLNSLAMVTPEHPEDLFIAAGAPWYLTLFGRDSIWAARMLLPVDLGVARGTLRTLARLQGSAVDTETSEEPGKIMHELRRGAFELEGMSLPPLYYGTSDATALWVCLLHDAWRAGLSDDDVTELLPVLERALEWITTYADADGDGFCEYLDVSGHGLPNQGWKDSADSVRFTDGTIATGAVALCEVQGYAYEAAVSGAALLDAFGRPGGAEARAWAQDLAVRFRESFWCGTGEDRYPALALDGEKRKVDSLTSNIGHLLGTGLLDAEEERLVALRVSSPELDSGLGLRTMSSADGGYAPLSYHCGSVWPHDTAIVVAGLVKAGLGAYAGGLVEGLLRASVAFDQRLPELYSGEGRPVPYPASCRPQAWSAAAAVVVAQALAQA